MAVGKEDVEIVKARIDKRDYRRVVLRNSLQVLLISDPDTDKVEYSSSSISDFDFDFDSDYLFFFFISIRSLAVLFSWFWFCLLHLQCAASMDVGVGYFSDPAGLEGLAHFLGIFSPFLTLTLLCRVSVSICVGFWSLCYESEEDSLFEDWCALVNCNRKGFKIVIIKVLKL